MARALFVDYENVHRLDFAQIPSDVRVYWFFGANQTKVPTSLLAASTAHPGGTVAIQAAGSGRDALDFHIAFQLGVELTRDPALECIVFTGDGGFDPLIRHLRKLGHAVTKMKPRTARKPSAPPPHFAEALALLVKSPKSRPKKRATLVKHLAAQLHSHDAAAESVVRYLVAEALISDQNGKLTYHLERRAGG